MYDLKKHDKSSCHKVRSNCSQIFFTKSVLKNFGNFTVISQQISEILNNIFFTEKSVKSKEKPCRVDQFLSEVQAKLAILLKKGLIADVFLII